MATVFGPRGKRRLLASLQHCKLANRRRLPRAPRDNLALFSGGCHVTRVTTSPFSGGCHAVRVKTSPHCSGCHAVREHDNHAYDADVLPNTDPMALPMNQCSVQ